MHQPFRLDNQTIHLRFDRERADHRTASLKAWRGRSMFFRERLPRSSKVAFTRPVTGFMDSTRDHNAASRSLRFEAGGDVHAIAVEIVTIHDQVAQVQAHAEHKRSVSRLVTVSLGYGLLKLDSGAQRINGAGELDQSTVAGQLDQTPSILCQNRIEMFRAVLNGAGLTRSS
jgi:hypothetical protein